MCNTVHCLLLQGWLAVITGSSLRTVVGCQCESKPLLLQGHLAEIENVHDVDDVMTLVLNDKQVSRATHNMMAYRVKDPDSGTIEQVRPLPKHHELPWNEACDGLEPTLLCGCLCLVCLGAASQQMYWHPTRRHCTHAVIMRHLGAMQQDLRVSTIR